MSLYDYQGRGAPLGKIVTGTKTITTAGTAVQVVTASTPIDGVWVGADMSGGPLVVGDSAVLATIGSMQGVVIVPGNPSTYINVDNLNLLYVDAQSSGNKLCYAYLQPSY